MRLIALSLVALLAAAPMGARAADIASGLDAVKRGEYRGAMAALKPLAEAGHPVAQYEVGVMYGNGDGVAQDTSQAARWFTLAAAQGNAQAKAGLAFLEASGLLTKPVATSGAVPPRGPDEAHAGDQAVIQVATVADEAAAAKEWRRQQKRFPEVLGNVNPVIQAFEAGGSYRVMGGPMSLAAAREACVQLKAGKATCLVFKQKPD